MEVLLTALRSQTSDTSSSALLGDGIEFSGSASVLHLPFAGEYLSRLPRARGHAFWGDTLISGSVGLRGLVLSVSISSSHVTFQSDRTVRTKAPNPHQPVIMTAHTLQSTQQVPVVF